MSEFHDNYPQYEMMAHHGEEEGKKARKTLWRVFWLLLVVTLVEVAAGIKWGDAMPRPTILKIAFVVLTIFKAYYIVFTFMHLGHERKEAKWMILGPYILFILFLAYMLSVNEGAYSETYREEIDQNIIDQQEMLRSGGGHGAAEEGHGDEAAEQH